jgi:hypothetical protein
MQSKDCACEIDFSCNIEKNELYQYEGALVLDCVSVLAGSTPPPFNLLIYHRSSLHATGEKPWPRTKTRVGLSMQPVRPILAAAIDVGEDRTSPLLRRKKLLPIFAYLPKSYSEFVF